MLPENEITNKNNVGGLKEARDLELESSATLLYWTCAGTQGISQMVQKHRRVDE